MRMRLIALHLAPAFEIMQLPVFMLQLLADLGFKMLDFSEKNAGKGFRLLNEDGALARLTAYIYLALLLCHSLLYVALCMTSCRNRPPAGLQSA